jgi:hypothetical protein
MITRSSNQNAGLNLPTLTLQINHVELTALLETGCEVTVVPRSKVFHGPHMDSQKPEDEFWD